MSYNIIEDLQERIVQLKIDIDNKTIPLSYAYEELVRLETILARLLKKESVCLRD